MELPLIYKSLINIFINSIKDIKINKMDIDIDITFKDKSYIKITNKEVLSLIRPIFKGLNIDNKEGNFKKEVEDGEMGRI